MMSDEIKISSCTDRMSPWAVMFVTAIYSLGRLSLSPSTDGKWVSVSGLGNNNKMVMVDMDDSSLQTDSKPQLALSEDWRPAGAESVKTGEKFTDWKGIIKCAHFVKIVSKISWRYNIRYYLVSWREYLAHHWTSVHQTNWANSCSGYGHDVIIIIIAVISRIIQYV